MEERRVSLLAPIHPTRRGGDRSDYPLGMVQPSETQSPTDPPQQPRHEPAQCRFTGAAGRVGRAAACHRELWLKCGAAGQPINRLADPAARAVQQARAGSPR